MKLADLSDEELVRGLHTICVDERRLLARLIEHLLEIENRGLDRRECSSLFVYCVKVLRMSEGAAYRRTHATALVRRFPSLLGRIERGEIHLSSLVLLKDHLTARNVDELVTEASGKTKLEVQAILARRAPRPDVPSMIRAIAVAEPLGLLGSSPSPSPSPPPPSPSKVEPLSPERHMVQLTVSSEGRALLERARDLMRHRNPSGDLGAVVESALALLVEKLEKERLGKTTRTIKSPRVSSRAGYVTRSVRREVFDRDGARCTFVGTQGSRCDETSFLELDHIVPRAKGGSDEAKNLRVTCRAHNLLFAERIFGKEKMKLRQRKSPPPASPPAPETTIDPEMLSLGKGALVTMGFADSDVRRGLEIVAARYTNGSSPTSIQSLLREALAVLTRPRPVVGQPAEGRPHSLSGR